jgi:hypothetical protein
MELGSSTQSTSFQWRVLERGGKEVVEFVGFIDEDSELPTFNSYRSTPVIIDCVKLKGLDSEGARVWKTFCRNHSGLKFILQNIPVSFVQNANFLPEFLPKNCTIESAAVKFTCETCDIETVEFFVKDNHYAVWPGGFGMLNLGSQRPCSCGKGHLSMMESVTKYFEFLKETS